MKKPYVHAFLLLLLLLMVVGQPVLAQEAVDDASPRWTPELSMQYKGGGQTALSPDGSLVAYRIREPLMEGEKSEYSSHIWVASADGATNYQYTQGEASSTNPAFSPDGEYLAFLSARSEKNQVWVLRVRGGEAEQITDAEAGVGSFRWAPDGSRIAYTMRDPETEEEKKRKKEKRDVILVDQNFKYSHLYTTTVHKNDAGERETKRLTGGDFHISSFDWSPDSRTIVFTHQPDPRINTGGIGQDIALAPADSGAVTPLVTWEGADRSPRFSPDGGTIAFVSHGGSVERVGLGDVYVIPATGGPPTKLAGTPDRNANLLGWAADGQSLFITEARHTARVVYALPVDGSAPRLVTPVENVISSVSFDRATATMAFVYQTPDTPPDLYVAPVDDFEMTKLTDVHAGVPQPPMGRTERLSWTSFDGMEIEGLLTYPVGYQQGQRVPLILQIHGGPAGVFTGSFTGGPSIYMTQVFAEHGYAVLRPNPRGSSGYGKDFRYANIKDWGFGDYEDIMSGVDEVVAMGVGHEDSLAVMGWSYGGYMTSFLVTRTGRFKAASMGAGLPNLISMVTTTDISDYLVSHMGGEFWDDYETYEKHSAIYRIKNVTTPTQVIHGANDLRVPFTQGREFYVALQRLGVPTEMIVYPRTPHGPREPKLLMDVSPRILTWFERHLQRQEQPVEEAPVEGGF
ncbi:MAG: S9 family peptidase [Bacteroidetes bacterium]|nr:S9 family peptidase [Bacteroidota bacterium]